MAERTKLAIISRGGGGGHFYVMTAGNKPGLLSYFNMLHVLHRPLTKVTMTALCSSTSRLLAGAGMVQKEGASSSSNIVPPSVIKQESTSKQNPLSLSKTEETQVKLEPTDEKLQACPVDFSIPVQDSSLEDKACKTKEWTPMMEVSSSASFKGESSWLPQRTLRQATKSLFLLPFKKRKRRPELSKVAPEKLAAAALKLLASEATS
jgi:hypothetical protein